MTQDKIDGVKRSHTTDCVNEIIFSDEEELVFPVSSKVEKEKPKGKSSKKGTTKTTNGSRKSSRKKAKESKTDNNILDFSD